MKHKTLGVIVAVLSICGNPVLANSSSAHTGASFSCSGKSKVSLAEGSIKCEGVWSLTLTQEDARPAVTLVRGMTITEAAQLLNSVGIHHSSPSATTFLVRQFEVTLVAGKLEAFRRVG